MNRTEAVAPRDGDAANTQVANVSISNSPGAIVAGTAIVVINNNRPIGGVRVDRPGDDT
jgi:hypothetical protein